jgi:hypothetical protein
VQGKIAFYPKALVPVLGYQHVLPGKITFGKTKVMQGIQQVCFPHAIKSADTYNRFGKPELLVKVIFELK